MRSAWFVNHDAASLDSASPSLPLALIQALLAYLVAARMVQRMRVR